MCVSKEAARGYWTHKTGGTTAYGRERTPTIRQPRDRLTGQPQEGSLIAGREVKPACRLRLVCCQGKASPLVRPWLVAERPEADMPAENYRPTANASRSALPVTVVIATYGA
jgi:hypothetical protein